MRKRVFVCPECGAMSTADEQILEERWDEVLRLSYNPETGECEAEDRDFLGLRYIHNSECNGEVTKGEVENIFDLLVEIVEEDDTLYAAPIGNYYLYNPQKLADVLAKAGYSVEVVNQCDLPDSN